ncbi:hypothetical protein J437_LFUL005833 [Ladona fulva]|uniref:G-protein coupled receptors family 1 profile domain-containing protein n=1 Tax=Ladona fulva TaxID=123851 RepID=A0A8K0KDX6_LADFU|nr:hypothetical protein J437_LFUL005833 [Ladona fulva]
MNRNHRVSSDSEREELQSVPTEEQVFWSTDTTPLEEDVSTQPPVLPPSAVVCSLDRRYEWVGTVFNSVDTVLAFLVPCVGIAALNFGIVASMREVGKRRAGVKIRRRSSNNRHLGGNGVVSSFRSEATSFQALCDGPRRQQPVGRRRRPHAKITGMLLVVSTVFVALNLPSYVIRAIIFFEVSIL